MQDAIDKGAFRTRGTAQEGSPNMINIMRTATEIAGAMTYLHSLVSLAALSDSWGQSAELALEGWWETLRESMEIAATIYAPGDLMLARLCWRQEGPCLACNGSATRARQLAGALQVIAWRATPC